MKNVQSFAQSNMIQCVEVMESLIQMNAISKGFNARRNQHFLWNIWESVLQVNKYTLSDHWYILGPPLERLPWVMTISNDSQNWNHCLMPIGHRFGKLYNLPIQTLPQNNISQLKKHTYLLHTLHWNKIKKTPRTYYILYSLHWNKIQKTTHSYKTCYIQYKGH